MPQRLISLNICQMLFVAISVRGNTFPNRSVRWANQTA